ncbi:PLP-dependent aminotransferase family protein [Agromyces subbeticus]|uniref:MocR-like pyridoxine biosynthesis transcription factor PdxR n=1 Tax=Agromyces subbeticus TaxID=293890 RepID=UPI0006879CA1|nr:PLP-dependent aminotransferase family protein [Agromyces subbeticus]
MLAIDRSSGRPLGVQLVEGVRRGILDGALRPGDPVPSTRALASELGVSRSAIVAAYEQLAGEGYLDMRQGAATRVAELPTTFSGGMPATGAAGPGTSRIVAALTSSAPTGAPDAEPGRTEPRISLLPGYPSTARIDARAWRAAWRHAAAREIPSVSPPPFGVDSLRAEIADHLRHARGVTCSPDEVVITAGTNEAVGLIAGALRVLRGAQPIVAVEHPGYPSARRALERRGMLTMPVAVDADGLDLEALRRAPHRPDAVMVTPSHQYPLGGRLPVATRLELLAWAGSTGTLVIEDDYDSEFRHTGPPFPALASLDEAGLTVLVGSFSKVLTPWLRLGYLVLPPAETNPTLRAAVAEVRADEACPVPGVAQEAMAALLAGGTVRRHIAVTRREYAHRRRLVLAALGDLPGAPLSALDGGLHAVIELPDAATSAAVVARLAAEGVAVAPLADYSAVAGDEQPGIVFGYAATTDTQLAEGLERIRAAIIDGGIARPVERTSRPIG